MTPFLESQETWELPPEEEYFYYVTKVGFVTLRSKRGSSNNTHISVGQNSSHKRQRCWPRNSQLFKKSMCVGPISIKWKRKPGHRDGGISAGAGQSRAQNWDRQGREVTCQPEIITAIPTAIITFTHHLLSHLHCEPHKTSWSLAKSSWNLHGPKPKVKTW